jgi:hypothetical protein
MTSIPFSLFRKFSASGFAPIVRNIQVETIANDGIDFIEVSNPETNNGYQKLEGTINSQSAANIYVLNINTSFFEIINGYRDSILYVESQETGVALYNITASRKVAQNLEVTIDGNIFNDFSPAETITIRVLPQVKISGDGTGAVAIPVFNIERTRISGIRILSEGSGYTQATAEIIDPFYFTQGDETLSVKAEIRPIISPKGGHGFNIISELKSKTIGLSGSVSSVGTNVADTGNYTTVALVKNPEFDEQFAGTTVDNRLKIELEGTAPTNSLVVGDVVTQIQGNQTLNGVIHEIEGSNIIYLVDYDGPYSVDFNSNFQLVVRGSVFNINTIESSEYVAGSGDVLFVADFLPVERSQDKTEQIKLLIDF